MKQKVHRDKLMFSWITQNHKLVMGFERFKHSTCSNCGKRIKTGNTLCDDCFVEQKQVSKK